MPLLIAYWKAGGQPKFTESLAELERYFRGNNILFEPSTIAEQIHQGFTDNDRFVREAELEQLSRRAQKEYTKNEWVVEEVKEAGAYWKKNNCILVVPSISRGRAFLKQADRMSFGRERDGATLTKNCLITVGATAPFPELLHSALQPECLTRLKEDGYTRITFQCGDSLNYFHELAPKDPKGLELVAFGFKKEGLHDDIYNCKEVEGVSEEGLAISHAGAGTILDVMRMGVPLIVVPNPSLLDNHQEELAIELERQGYVTYSDYKGLAKAIEKAGKLARKKWSGQNNTGGIAKVTDQILGYEDDVSARLD